MGSHDARRPPEARSRARVLIPSDVMPTFPDADRRALIDSAAALLGKAPGDLERAGVSFIDPRTGRVLLACRTALGARASLGSRRRGGRRDAPPQAD